VTEKRIPSWVTGALVAGGFLALAWLERRRPLRQATQPKLRREGRNLAVAAAGALVVQGLEAPIASRLTELVERRGLGLLKLRRLPWWVEAPLGVLLLDYTMYWWHVANHRSPLLWRTHLPHHADLDLDASTALRFHFAELVTTVPLRATQIFVLGVSPLTFSLWQAFFALSILFHHANLRLPLDLERKLLWVLVTPRMHGVHHSIVSSEADSNFSSGLSVWDRLHRSLTLNVPQEALTEGVPAFREPKDVSFARVLGMPFNDPPPWLLPHGGTPGRRSLPGPSSALEP
jgi:sterol desaturase/sphingolipid hydroxylase (fatty acid hydroxylase superfamily)